MVIPCYTTFYTSKTHLFHHVAGCHGTGTALGDPIEVGSVRACFWKGREIPLLVTTGKSHQGDSDAWCFSWFVVIFPRENLLGNL